jgi:DNA polymerase III delta prime subunit
MNTMEKYRPKHINEFVFANDRLKEQILRYTNDRTREPLILHGSHGTGKSLLAELIPKAIDGNKVSVNKINAEEVNNKKEVVDKFFRQAHFDTLFETAGQSRSYTVVEEVNFEQKAKGALRTCMDAMAGREQFIFTTNELNKMDSGLRSRCEKVEVLPAPPDKFFARAKYILENEGVEIDEKTLGNMLEAVYEADCDNRAYYRALDEVIDANWRAKYKTHGE